MARPTFSISVDAANDRAFYELRGALFKLEKQAKDEARDIAGELGRYAAQELRQSASGAEDKRQLMLADSITVKRDVTPVIIVGGSGARFKQRKVRRMSQGKSRRRTVSPYVGIALFGVEFGAIENYLQRGGKSFGKRTPRDGRGNKGNWIFPTLTSIQPTIRRRWFAEMDRVLKRWGN